MVKQLELKNVRSYDVDFSGGDNQSYSIINGSEYGYTRLQLDNLKYVYPADMFDPNNPHRFDCKFSFVTIDQDNKFVTSKELFNIKGLDLDGKVECDIMNRTFTVPLDESKEIGYADCLNYFMNNNLNLLIQ
ncbi:hypothetical protein [Wolbachia endosymbiont of Folsomia candida]|uniref:hypothetical protein n=1 Tax=Wolbachia endosymbiont of Folsomia candida TaxID=169402 RepID=UPI000AD2221B|nr:hypothetical protein [Wolbachia endosymbiont of Folsomia candida]APR99099.1 hypothetical protein ASM33_07935 [Wolbachia endosymbiont of Folsomia candida]